MSGKAPYDEKKILELLAEGSEFAFIQLFDRYRPQIYLAAVKFLDSKEHAEEIVQDVFMDVWQRREEMYKVLNFKAFLYAMVRNLVYKFYRHQSFVNAANEEFSRMNTIHNSTDTAMQEVENEKLLREAVDKLPQLQKEIFKLAKEDGLSHQVIASKLNLTVLSVKSHMKRALKSIRQKLNPHIGSGMLLLLTVFGEK